MKLSEIFFFTFASISVLTSCSKTDSDSQNDGKIVIESYINPGKLIKVKATKEILYTSEDTTAQYVNDLQITISDGTNSELMVYIGDGTYQSTSIIALENLSYTMKLLYNGEEVSSATTIPIKPKDYVISEDSIQIEQMVQGQPPSGNPEGNSVDLSWTSNDDVYYLVVVENTETDPDTINAKAGAFNRVFRADPFQGNNYQLRRQNFSYYGLHRIILFSLNAEYAYLYEMTGNNSLNLTTPPGNITNGLGIFTGINSDTLYLEIYK